MIDHQLDDWSCYACSSSSTRAWRAPLHSVLASLCQYCPRSCGNTLQLYDLHYYRRNTALCSIYRSSS